jgi:hypothetical protein
MLVGRNESESSEGFLKLCQHFLRGVSNELTELKENERRERMSKYSSISHKMRFMRNERRGLKDVQHLCLPFFASFELALILKPFFFRM